MTPTQKAERVRTSGGSGLPRRATGARLHAGALGALLWLLLTLSVASAAGSGLEEEALACPSGQTTWLRGHTTPGSGLLVRFNEVAVGGGSSGPDGAWAIPITVRERAGVYPVAVTSRHDGGLVAAFTCYVNVPLGATPTGMPTLRPTASPAPPVPLSTATVPAAAAPSTPASTPIATATSASPPPSTTALGGVDSPTATQPATLEPPPTTPTPVTPAPEPPPPAESAVVLVSVQADDPNDPELFEYTLLENTSSEPQSLAGWRLMHTGSAESYTFPEVSIPAGELLVIWSGDGEDDPATGTLYWPPVSRWAVGDTAELRDASGHVVSSLVVSPPEIEE